MGSGRTDVSKKKSSTPTNSGRGIKVGKSLSSLTSSKNGISVEYYFTSSGVWTHRAVLTLSKTKNKLYLDILDPQPPSRRKTLTNQRIKFILDSKLRIEHSVPFAKDFQLTLSGGGELIRHRVAFFSEDIGLDLIAFLQDRGVQIIRYRGNNLYNRRSQTTNVLRPISEEVMTNPAPPNVILRRKSTGSFDASKGRSPNKQTIRPAEKNNTSFLQRRNSMTSRSKGVSKTQWYDRNRHDDQDPNRLNSRHSLETDEDISTDSDDDNIFHQEKNSSVEVSDHHVDGLMNKLFHSTPTLSKNSKKSSEQDYENNTSNFIRGRAPTNEKLEKYKFMLINIEPDADILDPGTFALVDDEEEDSYLGFEFNDYPSEVLYSSYQIQHPNPIPPHPSAAAGALSAEKPNTQWLRRSFEQLSADMVDGVKGLERCKTYSTNASISLSTGNLLEKSEIPSLNPANRQPTEKLSSHNNQEPSKDSDLRHDIRRLLSNDSPTLTECL